MAESSRGRVLAALKEAGRFGLAFGELAEATGVHPTQLEVLLRGLSRAAQATVVRKRWLWIHPQSRARREKKAPPAPAKKIIPSRISRARKCEVLDGLAREIQMRAPEQAAVLLAIRKDLQRGRVA